MCFVVGTDIVVLSMEVVIALATVVLFALLIGLLHVAAVFARIEVGLYTPGWVDAILGAYTSYGLATPGRGAAVGACPEWPACGIHHQVAVHAVW